MTFRKWNQIQSLLHYLYVFPFNHERNTVQLKQERLPALRYTLSHPVFEQRGCVDGVMYRCYYRPQRSCGKVMFLHLSVILFTGGVSAPVHAGIQPSWADTAPGQTPLLSSACWDTHLPCPVHAGIHMATAADGTHPTGMHSCACYEIFL